MLELYTMPRFLANGKASERRKSAGVRVRVGACVGVRVGGPRRAHAIPRIINLEHMF